MSKRKKEELLKKDAEWFEKMKYIRKNQKHGRYWLGKKVPDHVAQKLIESGKAIRQKIKCINTGKIYDSQISAAKDLNIKQLILRIMRTAQICPTCATYTNALCVIYDGPYLTNSGISPLDDLEYALGLIDGQLGVLATNILNSTITLTTTGTSGPATLVGSALNIPNYSPAYTGWVGQITQSTTTAPTLYNLFSNTLANPVTFSRQGVGIYRLTCVDFDQSHTWGTIQLGYSVTDNSAQMTFYPGYIEINVFGNGLPADSVMGVANIEIRIYP
jgi:hypothetical protein